MVKALYFTPDEVHIILKKTDEGIKVSIKEKFNYLTPIIVEAMHHMSMEFGTEIFGRPSTFRARFNQDDKSSEVVFEANDENGMRYGLQFALTYLINQFFLKGLDLDAIQEVFEKTIIAITLGRVIMTPKQSVSKEELYDLERWAREYLERRENRNQE